MNNTFGKPKLDGRLTFLSGSRRETKVGNINPHEQLGTTLHVGSPFVNSLSGLLKTPLRTVSF